MPAAIAYLILTVLFETFGTASIQASLQFTRAGPSLGVALDHGLSFRFPSQALRTVPPGVGYATWSGFGIINIAVVGWIVFGQRLDPAAVLGLALVCAGIVVLHLFSGAARLQGGGGRDGTEPRGAGRAGRGVTSREQSMQNILWRGLKATADIPENPVVLVAALMLTGLAASMVLAREATEDVHAACTEEWRVPAGVFRAPHPALLAEMCRP